MKDALRVLVETVFVLAIVSVDASAGVLVEATLLASASTSAVQLPEVKKLYEPTPASSNVFGASVAISDKSALIGAANGNGGTGVAYLYESGMDYWGQPGSRLVASDATFDDRFGSDVAISGNLAVIGAHGKDGISGAAYIFEKTENGWEDMTESRRLPVLDADGVDAFGWSVAIDGDTALVSSRQDSDSLFYAGSAYIFQQDHGGEDNWGQVVKLTASDAAAESFFGESVSISGDCAVVGAFGPVSTPGAAYVFERNEGGPNNWGQVAKLTASDAAPDDNFGIGVSVSGDYIIVGAELDDDNGPTSGSAYIFHKPETGWIDMTETRKLLASDGANYDRFGESVSVNGDHAVVGARGKYSAGGIASAGAAYVYQRNGEDWSELARLVPYDHQSGHPHEPGGDHFGGFVSNSGEFVVVGALNDETISLDAGSAYIFQVPEPSTFVLLCMGSVSLLLHARRGRQRYCRCTP